MPSENPAEAPTMTDIANGASQQHVEEELHQPVEGGELPLPGQFDSPNTLNSMEGPYMTADRAVDAKVDDPSHGGPPSASSSTVATASRPASVDNPSSSKQSTDLPPLPPTPPPPAPSIHKRKLLAKPKGILKPAPPPTKAFSFRRDILQQLNTRLAQQGVNVQVPVPHGSLAGTAQGTAQAASSLFGGMLKRVSGFASGNSGGDEQHAGGDGTRSIAYPQRSASIPITSLEGSGGNASQRRASLSTFSSASTLVEEQSTPPGQATAFNNLPQPSASARPLRKVRFIVSSMSVVYPISGVITPGEEDATRRRIEQEHRAKLKARKEKAWTMLELEALYRECCRMREEHPLKRMRTVFQEGCQQSPPALKTIDLSFVPLDRHAIEPIADLLSIDFGLQKLVLENCGLTDEGLKSILHGLLVSGTLPSLSLASNKRIKYHGWRYVGIFMRRARALKYLDLSENSINRASLEHLIGALTKDDASLAANKSQEISSGVTGLEEDDLPLTIHAELLEENLTTNAANLTSLRLENCGLKSSSLEMLSDAVRYSSLNHLSLRRNRINQMGAVALAVMLKDYPDRLGRAADQATASSNGAGQARLTSYSIDDGRGRGVMGGASSTTRSESPGLPQIPDIVSSPGGGVTRRTMPPTSFPALHEASSAPNIDPVKSLDDAPKAGLNRHLTDAKRAEARTTSYEDNESDLVAAALHQAQRAKRILSSMPRIGSLLTLDLKGNDIRGGVLYLSQALKKNRTLKVLNLSDNSIEMMGLVAIANALKYNSTLETLDLSHNPCSGPALEGITTLRNAFTLNSNLKRLFLSDTELSSEGAIALAEFLPEARSLIHLDLTENLQIDIAGVMAMAVSVKMNKSLRCLDLNIPPNAPDFARLSQDILASCIRNTEAAQRRAQQKGVKAPIAAPIYKSTLARAAKEKEESNRLMVANRQIERMGEGGREPSQITASHSASQADEISSAARVTDAAEECLQVLHELLEREKEQDKVRTRERETVLRPDGTTAGRTASEFAQDLLMQSWHLRAKLKSELGVMQEGRLLKRALQINDDLEAVASELDDFYAGVNRQAHEEGIGDAGAAADSAKDTVRASLSSGHHLEVPASLDEDGLSSPNFSIGSDDDDDDDVTRASNAPAAARSLLAATSTDATLVGLGVETAVQADVQTAARDIPSEAAESATVDPETALANHRAKGQLSEEGEIFRRAKSLSIGEDEGDDDGRQADIDSFSADGVESNPGLSSKDGSGSQPASTLSAVAMRTPDSTDEVDDHDDSAVSVMSVEDRKDVSGEELRKELLGVNVPRRNSVSSVSSGSGAEGLRS